MKIIIYLLNRLSVLAFLILKFEAKKLLGILMQTLTKWRIVKIV